MDLLNGLRNEIIVSCQALPNEPLHGSCIMAKMALAACEGGAAGIRANGYDDIMAIREVVKLPMIGIVKKDYDGSDVYITPTIEEVKTLLKTGCEIIATDFTGRKRPRESLREIVTFIRENSQNTLIMADCSCERDVDRAIELGADIIGTTLSGYTKDTAYINLPNINLIKYAEANTDIPVFCEGGIKNVEQVRQAFASGAFSCVVGGAITRPQSITADFVNYRN